MGDINLAFGYEWREEKYTMYEGQKEAWMPGPWAMVHLLVDPETGSNYTAPGVGANGMQGTSPAEQVSLRETILHFMLM